MKKNSFTPISKIGEFELIKKITNNVISYQKTTKLGVGDDAAIVSFSKNKNLLVSTDMLVEGIHFDCTYTPLKHLGYKSVVVNVSDICAMNAAPTQATVSIAIPNKFSVEMIQEIYDGIKLACKNYSVDLVGGDTTATAGPLVISVNILGESLGSKLSLRSGAQNNDIVIVTGSLGAAYLGLQILEREKLIFKESAEVQPDLNSYKYILERQLKPEARIDVIKNLKNLKVIPTSMIDISDGLSSELSHISKSSNLGIKIFIDKIPFAKETRKTAEELNIDLLVSALFGGEDYELLFTVSLADFEKIKNNPIYSPIGHISKDVNGVKLYDSSGKSVEINHNSWTAFQK